MARFGFCAASSLLWGGWEFAVPFYSVQDCNLGQNRWEICNPPLPQIKDGKMARFGFCAASSLLWGEWGFAVPFYSVQDCNLGQNRWEICNPPPPQIKDGKMARFGFCAASSLLWGGWGFAVPFYSVQDCSTIDFLLGSHKNLVLYQDHTFQTDNNLHSQYLSA